MLVIVLAMQVDEPVDCSGLKSLGLGIVSGIYTIKPTCGSSLKVYCDMTTDGGGWLVSTLILYREIYKVITSLKYISDVYLLICICYIYRLCFTALFNLDIICITI